jgi:hypothetical protein
VGPLRQPGFGGPGHFHTHILHWTSYIEQNGAAKRLHFGSRLRPRTRMCVEKVQGPRSRVLAPGTPTSEASSEFVVSVGFPLFGGRFWGSKALAAGESVLSFCQNGRHRAMQLCLGVVAGCGVPYDELQNYLVQRRSLVEFTCRPGPHWLHVCNMIGCWCCGAWSWPEPV